MNKFKFLLVVNILIVIVFFSGMVAGIKLTFDYVDRTRSVPISTVKESQYPTGYQVLEELNKYRVKNNLPPFILSQYLCNNIGKRWQNYRDTDSHEGFQEFADTYMSGLQVTEILAPGNTADQTVKNWIDSPSHDSYIKNNSKACVYSANGLSVALLSN